jgi:hypothetical protein
MKDEFALRFDTEEVWRFFMRKLTWKNISHFNILSPRVKAFYTRNYCGRTSIEAAPQFISSCVRLFVPCSFLNMCVL